MLFGQHTHTHTHAEEIRLEMSTITWWGSLTHSLFCICAPPKRLSGHFPYSLYIRRERNKAQQNFNVNWEKMCKKRSENAQIVKEEEDRETKRRKKWRKSSEWSFHFTTKSQNYYCTKQKWNAQLNAHRTNLFLQLNLKIFVYHI